MGLNIKNERVCALAREAAELIGTTQTGAIEKALVSLIAEHRAAQAKVDKSARIDELMKWLAANITDEDRAAIDRTMEEMYDEDGLPR